MPHEQLQKCITKVKINDRYSSKQNWVRQKPLNKQMVQSLQILRKVYILNITSYHMPIPSVTKAPQQTHLSTLMCKKTHISFFHMTKATNWVLRFLKNERKKFSVL